MKNKFTVSEQKVVFLGGSHHGEEHKVNIIQIRNNIGQLLAVPKKVNITAKWSDELAFMNAKIEVEYYRLVYAFDPIQTPYLVIDGGNPAALLGEYLNNKSLNPSGIFQSQQGTFGPQLRMLEKLVPGLTRNLPIEHIPCPICDYIPDMKSIKHRIVHLNDHHKWSLEQIADYLEALPIDLEVREYVTPK